MNINQIRLIVADAYPGKRWHDKVEFMPDRQVFAIYKSLTERDKKKKEKPVLQDSTDDGYQLSVFDWLDAEEKQGLE